LGFMSLTNARRHVAFGEFDDANNDGSRGKTAQWTMDGVFTTSSVRFRQGGDYAIFDAIDDAFRRSYAAVRHVHYLETD